MTYIGWSLTSALKSAIFVLTDACIYFVQNNLFNRFVLAAVITKVGYSQIEIDNEIKEL